MKLGEVIRKYRKEKLLTQEEMAYNLGVTAPAVNKWENGNSYPDILLLAPIARLLGISTDTLLSYREELTEVEIRQIISGMAEEIRQGKYQEAFLGAMEKVKEYPNAYPLIYQIAQVLDSFRFIAGIDKPETYETDIRQLYERVRKSSDVPLAAAAAASLFYRCLDQGEYDKAEEYLRQIPEQGQDPQKLRAALCLKTDKKEEAWESYEKMLLSGYKELVFALNGISALAMKEEDMEKAEMLAQILGELARLMDMGEFARASPELNLALKKKDKEKCFEILGKMIHGVKGMPAFYHSRLFEHIKRSGENNPSNMAWMLKRGLEEDKSIEFLKDDPRFEKLMSELEKECREK